MNFCLAPWRGRWARWVPLLLQNVESQQKLEKKTNHFCLPSLVFFFWGLINPSRKILEWLRMPFRGLRKKNIDSWPKMVGNSACFPTQTSSLWSVKFPTLEGSNGASQTCGNRPPASICDKPIIPQGDTKKLQSFLLLVHLLFLRKKLRVLLGKALHFYTCKTPLESLQNHHRVSKTRTGGQNNPQNNPWTGQVGISPWC